MFISDTLKSHLETSATIQLESLVLTEWNMNMPDNIYLLGNYRYRRFGSNPKYNQLPNTFDPFDIGYATITTTSGGTTTLIKNSEKETVFNGSLIHSVLYSIILPNPSTLEIGTTYTLHNRSVQGIFVKSFDNTQSLTIPSNKSMQFILKSLSGTNFSSWSYSLIGYEETIGISGYYTKANESDVVVDGGLSSENIPQAFKSAKEKIKTIYSLEDCIQPFRPRSGITKPLYFSGSYIPNSGQNIARRPRRYMPSRYDQFKYWSSYRTENNNEYGIAKNRLNGLFYIDDAVPFVVYKDAVPANRLVIKMQTGIGDIDLGPFTTATGNIPDPLFGEANKTTPSAWKIQYLYENNWVDAYNINQNQTRDDGTPIIKSDGYVELQYGLIVPEQYRNIFVYAETLPSETLKPEKAPIGYSYLVIENENDIGTFYIYTGIGEDGYETFAPNYGWSLGSEEITDKNTFVTDFTSPLSFNDPVSGSVVYREFQYVRGIRIVVETMNKFDSTFDLIEFSPRLVADISNKVIDYNIKKMLSDIGATSLPVGQLLASVGGINIFDDDQSFNENNTTSIIANYVRKNIKFVFYEIIKNVEEDNDVIANYYVPIKTMYSEGIPQADITGASVSIDLRDFYFFLESMPAPRLLLTETSLSFAIVTLLDFIGFTNYTFRRIPNESDPVIPYFFVAPDQNVAEVLNQLAVATQTAMFFDEYNNFVVMSKNYLMPELDERPTDFLLLGNNNQTDTGVIENQSSGNLPNIISIASQDKKVYNDGRISYTTRYLQRTYGSIKQANLVDREKTWVYKPALLWEVSGDESTKTINEVSSTQGKYVLGAMPINSDLLAQAPTVLNNTIINNTLDLGENVYWLTRYKGYFYANGEIIKYDAAQFNITGIGNVWISSNQEYQRYFSELPFNGKIYPTGLVRIYAVPYYETIDGIERLQSGAVYEHGRGQFNTPIVVHTAGINPYWSNNTYVRGCNMESKYLFSTLLDDQLTATLPATTTGAAGVNNQTAILTTRNSIIKNFMATNYLSDTGVNLLQSTQTGTVQSSALVMNGPSFSSTETPINFISYVYKELNNSYKLFGTRMRVIGKIESNENRSQTPIGSVSYYGVAGALPQQNISIGGGSGGMGILINPETNNGYYFEIVALSENNIESYIQTDNNGNATSQINNILFYKIKKDSSNNNAIPVKLWGGLTNILVDDGKFTGQYRLSGDENTTVYDLSVEYQNIGSVRRFYLYINNKVVGVVDDLDPLPMYNNMALFTRGSSRVMFENIFAVTKNYSQNVVSSTDELIYSLREIKQGSLNESFAKYSMSNAIQNTYLGGISSLEPIKYNMYFDEFGTVMRECSYFDIKYDRSYPGLYAEIAPTINSTKGYVVSGFQADSYGAEFLIFNTTDTALNLDETSGNYLRINGVTFTQDTTYQLTVDEYFNKRSNFATPQLQGNRLILSPTIEKAKYDEIKQSRLIYGKNDFAIETDYIQSQDDAEQLMGWIINKIMKPKKSIGLAIFATPTIQLGDIVTINYKDKDNLDLVTSTSTRFVVYNIEYARSNDGPSMTLYLSEV
jgi:hypothetical protein